MERALLAPRGRSRIALARGESDAPLASAVMVACSESQRTTELLRSLNPGWVVQCLGGLTGPRDSPVIKPGSRASIEYASGMGGARHVILCGHSDCSFADPAPGPGRMDSRQRLLDQVRALTFDPLLGPRVHDGKLSVRALWIDDDDGSVSLYDPRAGLFEKLDDDGLEALVRSLDTPAPFPC